MHLRRITILDQPSTSPPRADVVLALGNAPVAADPSTLVLHPSSAEAAARYLLASPAVFRLCLDDPLAFLALVADLRRAPALRAA
jgi:hypothetical protein